MSAHTVVVAGAGIAGITTAYFEALKGHQVILLEPSSRAGGLLKSDCTPYGYFDYGTHVGSYTGIDGLDAFLFGEADEQHFAFFNPGTSGNYHAGALSSLGPFVDGRVLDAESRRRAESELLAIAGQTRAENLEALMIARYGSTLYREVFAPVAEKLLGDKPVNLAAESLYFFDMNRVLAFDAKTSKRLKKQSRYDLSLGFHGAYPGAQKLYPRQGGMGYWVDFLLDKLQSVGVRFLPGVAIESVLTQRGQVCQLQVAGESIAVDELVWSAPAALFARLAGSSVNFPPPRFRRTMLCDYAFSRPLETDCYYINVHDTQCLGARITLYSNLTRASEYHCCTVEVLGDETADFSRLDEAVLEELQSMGLVGADSSCEYRGMRSVANGFPVPGKDYYREVLARNQELDAEFSNVRFVGRAPDRFFMRDVLEHAYRLSAVDASRVA